MTVVVLSPLFCQQTPNANGVRCEGRSVTVDPFANKFVTSIDDFLTLNVKGVARDAGETLRQSVLESLEKVRQVEARLVVEKVGGTASSSANSHDDSNPLLAIIEDLASSGLPFESWM